MFNVQVKYVQVKFNEKPLNVNCQTDNSGNVSVQLFFTPKNYTFNRIYCKITYISESITVFHYID